MNVMRFPFAPFVGISLINFISIFLSSKIVFLISLTEIANCCIPGPRFLMNFPIGVSSPKGSNNSILGPSVAEKNLTLTPCPAIISSPESVKPKISQIALLSFIEFVAIPVSYTHLRAHET